MPAGCASHYVSAQDRGLGHVAVGQCRCDLGRGHVRRWLPRQPDALVPDRRHLWRNQQPVHPYVVCGWPAKQAATAFHLHKRGWVTRAVVPGARERCRRELVVDAVGRLGQRRLSAGLYGHRQPHLRHQRRVERPVVVVHAYVLL
jgi:hypothetical protein